jgi:hypothetical protein
MWNGLPEDAPAILERAYRLVLRAVELDPASAQANSLLATVLYPRMDWIGGEEAFTTAITLLSDRPILDQHANMLMRSGRTAAARAQYDAAESLEPLGGRPSVHRWYVSLAQRRFAEAREIVGWENETSRVSKNLEIALNEGDIEQIKTAIRALPIKDISTAVLYSPVLSEFDSPGTVLSTLRRIYGDASTQWSSKLHQIALLAAYFGDPEFALQVKAEEVRNTPVRLGAVWYPVMHDVRRLPGFKQLVTDINLVAYWRTYGWADDCRPLGDADFTCGR